MNLIGAEGSIQQLGRVQVFQGGLGLASRRPGTAAMPYAATVLVVYTDRGTVDVETSIEPSRNIPLLLNFSMNKTTGKIRGEVEYPQVGDEVLVVPLDPANQRRVALFGSVVPYLMDKIQSSQVVENASNKAFTLKLFEPGLEKVYRRVFPSGTSLEVKADGTLIYETPAGSLIQIDEAAGVTKITQKAGSTVSSIILQASGLSVTDAKGNTIMANNTKLTINGNLEISQ